MKNKILHELNFKTLLGYPDEFQPQCDYEKPICCHKFCIECERSGVANTGGVTLMSHGCDTDDFEKILGSKVDKPAAVEDPIMFLLEEPGKDFPWRKERSFSGVTKKIPVCRYYFSPTSKSWPQSIDDVNGDYYGTYFAYIMRAHSLADVYITNLVKCKWDVKRSPSAETNCVRLFLAEEIKEFKPRIVFCFGRKAYGGLCDKFPDLWKQCVYLYHPAARMKRSKFFSENDEWIRDALHKRKQA